MTFPSKLLLAWAALAAAGPAAYAQGDAAAGKAAYMATCAACHSLDFNGAGPMHRNLIGRRAGSVPGFAYSKALKESGITWNEESLSRWLTDPEKLVPGQRMFVSVPDAKERADIVAYLQLVAGPPPTNPARLEMRNEEPP